VNIDLAYVDQTDCIDLVGLAKYSCTTYILQVNGELTRQATSIDSHCSSPDLVGRPIPRTVSGRMPPATDNDEEKVVYVM
jgi:hypothetical protein